MRIAASWTNGLERKRGYNGPYKPEDKDYCSEFVTEKKSQDDCRYAYRKIVMQKLRDHAFCITFYRCVGYMVIGGKYLDALDVEKASGLAHEEWEKHGPAWAMQFSIYKEKKEREATQKEKKQDAEMSLKNDEWMDKLGSMGMSDDVPVAARRAV
ncbi:hypothetical protein CC86DRAFT_401176 [Ophiobolus disseminans]|uniref:Uncharacterized protein n=1 Tax=Ophiobolus disseminans TaxID=1469910 RepID=A0A6A7AGI3_9PLEO|nr:hypothetical protein CC86DRAFT_401176 [Ophiobolus disseminans]